jgi:hypothetical protein
VAPFVSNEEVYHRQTARETEKRVRTGVFVLYLIERPSDPDCATGRRKEERIREWEENEVLDMIVITNCCSVILCKNLIKSSESRCFASIHGNGFTPCHHAD